MHAQLPYTPKIDRDMLDCYNGFLIRAYHKNDIAFISRITFSLLIISL